MKQLIRRMNGSDVAIAALLAAHCLTLCAAWCLSGEPKSVTVQMDDGSQRVFLPEPATAPARPKILKAADQPNRGVGVRIGPGWIPVPFTVDGYSQNVVVDTPGPVTLSGIRSLNAWPDDQPAEAPAREYQGQGTYVYHASRVSIDGSLFAWNGWQPGRPVTDKTVFRHGLYLGDESGAAAVSGSVFAGNAAVGLQARGTGDVAITGCVFINNATGVLAKQKTGVCTIDGCLFLGSDWTLQTDRAGAQVWADANGVTAFAPTTVRNCTFVGLKRAPLTDGRKRGTPNWLAVASGVQVDSATGNRVVQWAGPGIDYDPAPVVAECAAGRVSVADTISRIRADVGRLAP